MRAATRAAPATPAAGARSSRRSACRRSPFPWTRQCASSRRAATSFSPSSTRPRMRWPCSTGARTVGTSSSNHEDRGHPRPRPGAARADGHHEGGHPRRARRRRGRPAFRDRPDAPRAGARRAGAVEQHGARRRRRHSARQAPRAAARIRRLRAERGRRRLPVARRQADVPLLSAGRTRGVRRRASEGAGPRVAPGEGRRVPRTAAARARRGGALRGDPSGGRPLLTVAPRELLEAMGERLALRLVAGARGLDRAIAVPRVQQPGLALAGFLPQLHPDRIQVLGNSEIAYLSTLPPEGARAAVRGVAQASVACFVVTNATAPPPELVDEAERADVPLFASGLPTGSFIPLVTHWLEERLAATTLLHADFVEVGGLGVLITGRSGIGKSEVALDLVSRGHRFVADDIVVVRRLDPAVLRGGPGEVQTQHM